MVCLSSLALAASTLASYAAAYNVDCLVDGVSVATVDSDTGSCPFSLPDELPVEFSYTDADNYNVTFYYTTGNSQRYFNDIRNAGRIIEVPASVIIAALEIPLFSVHVDDSSASNSTHAAKRFASGASLYKRDAIDDFIAGLKTIDGVAVPSVRLSVANSTNTNTTSSAEPVTSTETQKSTTIITITSCDDNKCHETTTPATLGPVTTTTDGTVTVLTTWCPVSDVTTETHKSTKIITVTSCEDNKCHETTKPATYGPVTTTSAGTVTVVTTWCPVEETSTPLTTVKPTVKPSTVTTAPGSSVAPKTTAAVSTYDNAAGQNKMTLMALAMLPLAYFF